MDNLIQTVEEEIRKVEDDIQAAIVEQARATNKDDKDYWRKEKEQLRKEKEQLRKKEEQLREESLIVLRSGATKSTVEELLQQVVNEQRVISNEQRVISNEQRVISNEQRVISNNQRVISSNQRVITSIVVTDLKHAFKPPSTGKESRGSNRGFRDSIAKFYGMGKRPTCMVLGKALPSEFLVAGHLYAVRWERYSRAIMGKDFNIDSPRNGIIWCSAIEHEYEHQRICFSKGIVEVEFILHVLDKSLLPVKLSSVGQHKANSAFEAALGDVTFGNLHNKRVTFAGAGGVGPFKRALALHAKFALEQCAKTYPDDFDPQEFNFEDLSEYEGKQEFFHKWLDQLDSGSVMEGETEEEEEEASVEEQV